jgi:predicted DNA-binding transcriptional regulator AlpA
MTDRKRALDLVVDVPPPPPNRGRLLYVEDIAAEVFRGRKSAWWVRHNVAPDRKIKIGRDCAWYEADVYAWLERQRVTA